MKTIKVLLIIIVVSILACKKDCETNQNTVCNETPPTNEVCLAYFERWFYDNKTNSCEKIGYSGCSQKGFETKEECEECKCN